VTGAPVQGSCSYHIWQQCVGASPAGVVFSPSEGFHTRFRPPSTTAMAAISLQQTRMIIPSFKLSLSHRLLSATTLIPSLLSTARPLSWGFPTFQSLLELFPPFLLAVPKKKTSHSRKAMRSANKGLEDKRNLVHCPGCGSPKLAHHLCPECYSSVNRAWKAKGKQTDGGLTSGIPLTD